MKVNENKEGGLYLFVDGFENVFFEKKCNGPKAQTWNKQTMVNTLTPSAVSILIQFTFGMSHFLLHE